MDAAAHVVQRRVLHVELELAGNMAARGPAEGLSLTTGAVTTMHDFLGGTDGYFAQGKPIQGKDGYLYGTTLGGGDPTGAYGTVYKYSMN